MPNIKPISDLRNYTEVLKEVSTNQPVYLTRNGRGAYAIVEVDELDRLNQYGKKCNWVLLLNNGNLWGILLNPVNRGLHRGTFPTA